MGAGKNGQMCSWGLYNFRMPAFVELWAFFFLSNCSEEVKLRLKE